MLKHAWIFVVYPPPFPPNFNKNTYIYYLGVYFTIFPFRNTLLSRQKNWNLIYMFLKNIWGGIYRGGGLTEGELTRGEVNEGELAGGDSAGGILLESYKQ